MKIVVSGPPGAGNRLVARCLKAAGKWDVEPWHLPGKIMEADAYVLTWRDEECLVKSILKEGMVRTEEQALEWLDQALDQRAEIIKLGKPVILVKYEEMFNLGTERFVQLMAQWVGVKPWKFAEEVYDGNAKYYPDQ